MDKEMANYLLENIKSHLSEQNFTERERTLSAIREHCSQQQEGFAKRLNEGVNKFTEIDKDMESLKRWQKSQNGCLEDIKTDINKIKEDINSMKHEYLQGRPTWAMMIIISIAVAVIGTFIGGIIW